MISSLWLIIQIALLPIFIGSACLNHPADLMNRCLERQIPCLIDKCLWCQSNSCMECEPGFYLDFEKGACIPCSNGCRKCFGPAETDCFSISSGFSLSNGKIVAHPIEGCLQSSYEDNDFSKEYCVQCKAGYQSKRRDDKQMIDHMDCNKCTVENCSFCQNSVDSCQICNPGFKLDGNTCVNKAGSCKDYDVEVEKCKDCLPGQTWSYQTLSCVSCPEECLSCGRSGKCLGCKNGCFYQPDTMTCTPCLIPGCQNCADGPEYCVSCTNGKYFDLLRNKCLNCHETCGTCTGPKEEDCDLCKVGKRRQEVIFSNFDTTIIKFQLQAFREKFPKVMAQSTFMTVNFHPQTERLCVTACRDQAYYRDRFDELSVGSSATECPSVSVLHHLMSSKNSGYYASAKHPDSDAREKAEEASRERRKRASQVHEDLLQREKEEALSSDINEDM